MVEVQKKVHQIIELGAVKYKNGQIVDKFESLVYAKEIPIYVQEVTKIILKCLKCSKIRKSIKRV
jgi:DNA polymerase-3 subunit epsilon